MGVGQPKLFLTWSTSPCKSADNETSWLLSSREQVKQQVKELLEEAARNGSLCSPADLGLLAQPPPPGGSGGGAARTTPSPTC